MGIGNDWGEACWLKEARATLLSDKVIIVLWAIFWLQEKVLQDTDHQTKAGCQEWEFHRRLEKHPLTSSYWRGMHN